MAKQIPQPPRAAILMESLRDIGYSLDTAIADIIDNSISAEATEVTIACYIENKSPIIAIADNGYGMNQDEILQAMKHGSKDPSDLRERSDLGRFGLGLKTASFSQCRQLTVVSLKDGKWSGAEWDLDLVRQHDDWLLTELEPNDIQECPRLDLIKERGTLVIWRKLDRLFDGDDRGNDQYILNEKIASLSNHLSLVFHRYLSGEFSHRFSIILNGQVLKPFDPFLKGNTTKNSSDLLETEILHLESGQGKEKVTIQPYILPHFSRLTPKEADFYENRSDYLSNQGIYIYRNGRLMIWGKWFRLHSQSESTKYARIQVDYPNTLDHLWTIDIKKSTASLPPVVRDKIKQLLPKIEGRSTQIHRKRGKKLIDEDIYPVWNRYAQQEGPIKYSINRDHPLITELVERIPTDATHLLNLLLDTISNCIPAESIYDDLATSPRRMERKRPEDEEIIKNLQVLASTIKDRTTFITVVKAMHTFDEKMQLVEKFADEVFNGNH